MPKLKSHSGAKKIYRATLELQTLEFEKANADIAALVEQYGGYFEEKSLSTYSSSYRHADYTVRVPAAQFESFCAQVGDLCHVTYTTSSAEDITIESAISETEYAIDALSGTLRSYDSLVDYATIYLNLEEVYRLSNTVDAPKTFGEKMGNAFADGVKKAGELLESIAIWLAYNWLTLIIWAVILTAVILLVRRVRRGVKLPKIKLGKKKQITAQTEENDRTEE